MTRDVAAVAAPVFQPRRVAHVNLFVSHLDRSSQFYSDVAGFQRVFDEPGIKASFFSNGNTHHDVALVESAPEDRVGRDGQVQISSARARRVGLYHMAFEMESEKELVAAWTTATRQGLKIDRTVNHQVCKSVYLFDREGNYLEFYADTGRDWRAVFQEYEGELVTEHWDPLSGEPLAEPRYSPVPDISVMPHAVFQPRRLARVTLLVTDLARERNFYRGVVGLDEVFYRVDNCAVFSGRAGGIDLVLFAAATTGLPRGLHHLGFEMPSDVSVEEGSVRAKRLKLTIDARIENHLKRSVVVRDPDGIACEFFVERHPLSRQSVTSALESLTDQSPFLL